MTATTQRRARRIAADEAHAWARNLRLGNPYAKLVLSMTTLYVNGEGSCFVGIDQLADDTELSTDTVRKRLAWLEGIGAILRVPQWLDPAGRRNSEGRGRRTSDEIRLLIGADPGEIEARAKGDDEAQEPAATTEISPRCQQGLNPEQNPVSPGPALCQPSDSGKGLTSEPEPEKTPPYPPPGGVDQEAEREKETRFAPFAAIYPIPITDTPKAMAIFEALAEAERADAILGAKGYAAFIAESKKTGRSRNVKDAHRWLRDRLWVGYLALGKQLVAQTARYEAACDSPQWNAWMIFYHICGSVPGIPAFLISHVNDRRNIVATVPAEWPPVGAGLSPDVSTWREVAAGSGEFAAWLRRLRECPGVRIALRKRLRDGQFVELLTVPTLWPPARAGKDPPDGLSDEDARALSG